MHRLSDISAVDMKSLSDNRESAISQESKIDKPGTRGPIQLNIS